MDANRPRPDPRSRRGADQCSGRHAVGPRDRHRHRPERHDGHDSLRRDRRRWVVEVHRRRCVVASEDGLDARDLDGRGGPGPEQPVHRVRRLGQPVQPRRLQCRGRLQVERWWRHLAGAQPERCVLECRHQSHRLARLGHRARRRRLRLGPPYGQWLAVHAALEWCCLRSQARHGPQQHRLCGGGGARCLQVDRQRRELCRDAVFLSR